MKSFSQYIIEAKNCPAGTKYCNKCGSCVAKTCEEKAAMKEAAEMNPADAQKQQQLQRRQLMLNRQKLQLQMKAVSKKKQTDMMMQSEGTAWTKKEGQNKEGGLDEIF
jgi:hypothetical protein